jgi:outer membrane protein, heavy metal efflux system
VKSNQWRALCVFAGSVMHVLVHAQSMPSIASAVDAAWQRAVAAREADGRVERARADRKAAGSLWAAPPALELSHYDDRLQHSTGRRESEIGLAWPLWLPGQRSARETVAQADMDVAELARDIVKLHVADTVREAAWALSAREAELSAARAQTQALHALTEDVERRVRAGDLARADALAARAELLAATAAEAQAIQRRDRARSDWTTLTGMDPVADAAEPDSGRGAAEHPEITLATLAVERAQENIELVRLSKREPPELIARFRQDAAGNGASAQNMVGIAIRIPFGTDGRNAPMQAAALGEFDIAQTALARTRERVESDILLARTAIAASENQLAAEKSRFALLQERARLIEKSFHAGETPLPELLRALAAAALAESNVARQQAELGRSRARLLQSLGILP